MKINTRDKYKNYFKNHYRNNYSMDDIKNYVSWFSSQWRIISSFLKINKNDSILEIGSGVGGFYNFIDEKENENYVGIEMDSDAVDFANSIYKNKFKNVSIEEFESNDKFDFVFAFEVLEHIVSPIEAILKINQLLEKGGVFCGTSPYPFEKNVFADSTHLFVLHPQNWKKLFLENGFNEVDIYPMTFFPFLWRINKNFNFRLPFYLPFPFFVSTCLIIAKK